MNASAHTCALVRITVLTYDSSMLPAERRRRILEDVRNVGELDVPTLARKFSVSRSTIRRDLNYLHRQGKLYRVRGGTLNSAPGMDLSPLVRDDKTVIGKAAAALVNEGNIVGLDFGSTCSAVAKALVGRHVTVVTASLAIIDILRHSPETDLIVLGGLLRHGKQSLVGPLTEHNLSQLHTDIAFLGTSGFNSDLSVMDSTGIDVSLKQMFIEHSERTYVVAGPDKFPGSGITPVTHVSAMTGLITTAQSRLVTAISDHTEVIHP